MCSATRGGGTRLRTHNGKEKKPEREGPRVRRFQDRQGKRTDNEKRSGEQGARVKEGPFKTGKNHTRSYPSQIGEGSQDAKR